MKPGPSKQGSRATTGKRAVCESSFHHPELENQNLPSQVGRLCSCPSPQKKTEISTRALPSTKLRGNLALFKQLCEVGALEPLHQLVLCLGPYRLERALLVKGAKGFVAHALVDLDRPID